MTLQTRGQDKNHNTWEFGYYPYQMVVDDWEIQESVAMPQLIGWQDSDNKLWMII
jgi:hypothetical protein